MSFPPPRSSRGGFVRTAAMFVGIVVLVFGAFVALKMHELKKGQDEVERLHDALARETEALRAEQMKDTVGGTTPQQTLELYIAAVEKGDYDLASKYFVRDQQESWRLKLVNYSLDNKLLQYLTPLKESLKSKGEFSESGENFSIYKPVNIDFQKYPNGVWKITEI